MGMPVENAVEELAKDREEIKSEDVGKVEDILGEGAAKDE